jgi:hypothetical protein
MSRRIERVLDNPHVTIWYYPDQKIVHHQIHKFLFGEAFRSALTMGADTLIKHGATKWLSDDRNNTAIPAVDVDWGNAVWFPRTLKAGWKYWAIVMPEKTTGKMSMRRLVNRYSKAGVTTELFSSTEEGLAWLEAQRPERIFVPRSLGSYPIERTLTLP